MAVAVANAIRLAGSVNGALHLVLVDPICPILTVDVVMPRVAAVLAVLLARDLVEEIARSLPAPAPMGGGDSL